MPDMHEQAKLIISQLAEAFAKTPKPGAVAGPHLEPLAPGITHPAADWLNENLRGKSIEELEADLPNAIDVAEDLPVLAPPAVRYYLPGLLRRVLRDLLAGDRDERLVTTLTLALSNQKATWPDLTIPQHDAVLAWVNFVGTHLRNWDLGSDWEENVQQQLRAIRKSPWLRRG